MAEGIRVVVTGMGAITPFGIGTDRLASGILEGKSCVTSIDKFDASAFSSRMAAQVPDFVAEEFIDGAQIRKMARFIQLAIAASKIALGDSGLIIDEDKARRVGVYIASAIGGLDMIEQQRDILLSKGPRRVSPFLIPSAIPNLAAGNVAIELNAKGPNLCHSTACAASVHSIGEAYRAIRSGKADVIFAGGSEATITPLALAGFCSMRALSCRNDEPQKASRPFDKLRDGFVMGEGAGTLVLEEYNHANKRGANILAEIIGYAANADAYDIAAPCPKGEGAYLCMKEALSDAGIEIDKIDYINAHGTSTPLNDKTETDAIKRLFGNRAYQIPASSTKSMVGHLLGAAGAVETIASIICMNQGILHPTINYEHPDPDCNLDYVPNKAREHKINYMLKNSFGFGGTNGCLVLKRFEA